LAELVLIAVPAAVVESLIFVEAAVVESLILVDAAVPAPLIFSEAAVLVVLTDSPVAVILSAAACFVETTDSLEACKAVEDFNTIFRQREAPWSVSSLLVDVDDAIDP
jgi:predicted dinucleotide-binding enzyme